MKTRRRGYTLFQLLVLLAFLLILMAMLFPATLQVRASAARMRSQNNLKQIGLAMHNYESVFAKLPPGADPQGFSGLALFLPYIEQENTYKAINFMKSAGNADNAAARKVRVAIYESPLDEAAPPDDKSGPTSYFLVAGSKAPLEKNDGIFFLESKLTIISITDGTSNTIMSLESLRGDASAKPATVRRQHVALAKGYLKGLEDSSGVKDFQDGKHVVATRGAAWMDGKFLQGLTTVTRPLNDEKPDVDCGGEGGLAGPRSYNNGTNVGFADGSVRFLTTKADFDTWKKLATAAGGEVIANDF